MSKQRFTLMELLVVLAIVMLMAGMVVGVTKGIGAKSRPAASMRKVSAMISLTRQYAISENCRVALLIPAAGELDDSAVKAALGINETLGFQDRSLQACVLKDGKFERWISGQQWVFLEDRTTIEASGCSGVVIVPGHTVRGIVWKGNGSLTNTVSPIVDVLSIVEGEKEYWRIAVNWLAGKGTITKEVLP